MNKWAKRILFDAYEKVYNDSSTSTKDALKIKKIMEKLK